MLVQWLAGWLAEAGAEAEAEAEAAVGARAGAFWFPLDPDASELAAAVGFGVL